MLPLSNVCEACKRNPIGVEEESDVPTQPYKICEGCHERLMSNSLKPIEWYNLAVFHSPMSFLLHDDFYEEDGEATQPEEDVVVTQQDLAPTLKNVMKDMEALIDFAITRWYLEADVVNVLKEHDKTEMFKSIKTRFSHTDSPDIKARLIEITSEVLKGHAEEWIRELWTHYGEELLVTLSEATANCLPAQEGLQLVLEKLEALNDKEKNMYAASCLYHFRSPDVLLWIEKNCKVFHDNWGRLTAVSFPTWETMKSWLNKGRPLSLVALDAMEACADEDRLPIIAKYKPQILGTNITEIEPVLINYLQHDAVPRVKNKIEWILEDKDIIFTR